MRNYYVDGQWNVICDRCALKYKSSALRREWTGLMVCESCFETRHPQTLIRVPDDNPAAPWTRGESTDIFTGPQDIQTEDLLLEFLTENTAVAIVTES